MLHIIYIYNIYIEIKRKKLMLFISDSPLNLTMIYIYFKFKFVYFMRSIDSYVLYLIYLKKEKTLSVLQSAPFKL